MKKVTVIIFLSVSALLGFFAEELSRKYYNGVFHGGKERLVFLNPGDEKKINLKRCSIKLDLYEEYVRVDVEYEIESRKETNFYFLFPKIDSIINKNIYTIYDRTNEDVKVKNKLYKIEGNYEDFRIFVNDESRNFMIETSDMLELDIPYKLGDENEYYDENMNFYKESVESYTFLYGWYKINLDCKEKTKTKIRLSYNCGYYFNETAFDVSKSAIEIEDPALKYDYAEKGNQKTGMSEKIFTYNLYTSYSNEEMPADRTYIQIVSHLIDRELLKIMPTNYKRSGISYLWKYKNLKAKQINNITVSILSSNSDRMINIKDFKVSNERKSGIYEMNKKNAMVMEYTAQGDDKKTLPVNEIRILPDYFRTKDHVEKTNIPLEFEIYFSMNGDFSNAKKITRKFREKDFLKLINKRNYLNLYKGREIECKFIKIKIIRSSDDNNDVVKIRNIEVLRK